MRVWIEGLKRCAVFRQKPVVDGGGDRWRAHTRGEQCACWGATIGEEFGFIPKSCF